ncbi:MAG: IS1634 family transposase [Sphaerochaetaceae bacterium]
MKISKLPEKKSGRTRINIVDNVRRADGSRTTKVFCFLGYLDDLEKEHTDAVAWAKEEAKRMTEAAKAEKIESMAREDRGFCADEIIKLGKDMKPYDAMRNLGYLVFTYYYKLMELPTIFARETTKRRPGYNLSQMVLMLVCNRIICPSSKVSAFGNRNLFPEDFDFELHDVYRSLSVLTDMKERLLTHINKRVDAITGRDNTLFFYDVTNYYFEIDRNDDYRKKGCSKENRPNPIVQMGLFMDQSGLPVSYETYPGNTNDVTTFIPSVKKLRENGFPGLKHTIFVADKGMMSGDNVARLRSQKSGYIISDSVRCVKEEFLESYVFPEKDYIEEFDRNGELAFKYKRVTAPIRKYFKDYEGRKVTDNFDEDIIVLWSKKYEEKARYERSLVIKKAEALAKNPRSLLGFQKGAKGYVVTNATDKNSGESIEENVAYETSINNEKILKEEKCDGYYLIRTNVIGLDEGESPMDHDSAWTKENFLKLNKKVEEKDIIEMYRGLWKIEESFRITKSGFAARPVFCSTREHIDGHFLICFLSLLLIRLLERDMKGKVPIPQMLESLRKANYDLDPRTNILKNLYLDQNLLEIMKKTPVTFNLKNVTPGKLKEMRGVISRKADNVLNEKFR